MPVWLHVLFCHLVRQLIMLQQADMQVADMHVMRYVTCSELVVVKQDASELSELWASVGALFAEGDVHRIATALATMRRSVSLVGHVPEFQGSAQRLAVRPSHNSG